VGEREEPGDAPVQQNSGGRLPVRLIGTSARGSLVALPRMSIAIPAMVGACSITVNGIS
jgi:hypothetical protein